MNPYVYPGLKPLAFRLATDYDKMRIIFIVVEKYYHADIRAYRRRGRNPNGDARKMFCYLVYKHTDLVHQQIADYAYMDRSTVSVHIKGYSGNIPEYIRKEIETVTSKLYEYEGI